MLCLRQTGEAKEEGENLLDSHSVGWLLYGIGALAQHTALCTMGGGWQLMISSTSPLPRGDMVKERGNGLGIWRSRVSGLTFCCISRRALDELGIGGKLRSVR